MQAIVTLTILAAAALASSATIAFGAARSPSEHRRWCRDRRPPAVPDLSRNGGRRMECAESRFYPAYVGFLERTKLRLTGTSPEEYRSREVKGVGGSSPEERVLDSDAGDADTLMEMLSEGITSSDHDDPPPRSTDGEHEKLWRSPGPIDTTGYNPSHPDGVPPADDDGFKAPDGDPGRTPPGADHLSDCQVSPEELQEMVPISEEDVLPNLPRRISLEDGDDEEGSY